MDPNNSNPNQPSSPQQQLPQSVTQPQQSQAVVSNNQPTAQQPSTSVQPGQQYVAQQSPATDSSQYPQPVNQTMFSNSLVLQARLGIFSIVSSAGLACLALPPNVSIKENLDVFYDQARTQPFFNIRERKALGISQTFDVLTVNGQLIASFQHSGLASIVRESWLVLDPNGTNIGSIQQGLVGGLFGRFGFRAFIPQKFTMTINSQLVAEFSVRGGIHHFNTSINFLNGSANSQNNVLVLAAAFVSANRRSSGAENGPVGI